MLGSMVQADGTNLNIDFFFSSPNLESLLQQVSSHEADSEKKMCRREAYDVLAGSTWVGV